MSSNHKDESPQPRAQPDQPLAKSDATVERDRIKPPMQPADAEPRPAERPDLWAEHED